MKNKAGLSRTIPNGTKRLVRQRCGFGCVICGNAIIQYEHFNPEFENATKHDSNGITLLCGYCHDLKTRGFLSVDSVIAANKNPYCLQKNNSKFQMDISSSPMTIKIHNMIIIDTKVVF